MPRLPARAVHPGGLEAHDMKRDRWMLPIAVALLIYELQERRLITFWGGVFLMVAIFFVANVVLPVLARKR